MIRSIISGLLCAAIALLHPAGTIAQHAPKQAVTFRSINEVGLLEGEQGSALQLQTVNGVRYKSWYAGIGVGLDYYRIRSIPLFLNLRKSFAFSGNRFFAYADGGIHFAWATDDQKVFQNQNFSNGPYLDLGVGYEFKTAGRVSWIMSVGYSYKKTTQKSGYTICPFAGPCYLNPEHIDYNLNRLLLKVGIAF